MMGFRLSEGLVDRDSRVYIGFSVLRLSGLVKRESRVWGLVI